jgi:hypothetical protein
MSIVHVNNYSSLNPDVSLADVRFDCRQNACSCAEFFAYTRSMFFFVINDSFVRNLLFLILCVVVIGDVKVKKSNRKEVLDEIQKSTGKGTLKRVKEVHDRSQPQIDKGSFKKPQKEATTRSNNRINTFSYLTTQTFTSRRSIVACCCRRFPIG